MRFSNQDLPILLKGKTNLVGIEIGVERGEGAFNLLTNCEISKLYLIDPYEPYSDLSDTHNCDATCQANNKKICLDLIQGFVNFELLEKKSDDCVNLFEDESIDFIFIDGLHSYQQCLADITNYYPKIKNGGLISGHDFNFAEGVNKAVREFAGNINKEILTCERDVWYWFK